MIMMRAGFLFTVVSCILWRGSAFHPTGNAVTLRKHTVSFPSSSRVPRLFSTTRTTTTTEEWTPKRIHNTNWFRSSAILLALVGVGNVAPIPARPSALIHILSFGTWFGTVFYTTFILGLTMFKHLPRQTFGKLQSKLFPKYFSLCSIAIILQIITLRFLPLEVTNLVKGSLGGALFMTLFNQFYLEPVSTKVMLERYDLENAEGGQDTERYKQLKSSFGKLHGMSSLSNLIALIGAVVYGYVLSSLLL